MANEQRRKIYDKRDEKKIFSEAIIMNKKFFSNRAKLQHRAEIKSCTVCVRACKHIMLGIGRVYAAAVYGAANWSILKYYLVRRERAQQQRQHRGDDTGASREKNVIIGRLQRRRVNIA